MKKADALALIEFAEIPAGLLATDGMLKQAPIAFIRSGTVGRGRYLTLVGGSPAAVEESYRRGMDLGAGAVLDHLLLADVHPAVYTAILGRRETDGAGALAVVETATAVMAVRAAEAALKGTTVRLVELRLADSGLAGKGLGIYQGDLHDVEAAVELALGACQGSEFRHTIISSPHEALGRQLAAGTRFDAGLLLDLDGEVA